MIKFLLLCLLFVSSYPVFCQNNNARDTQDPCAKWLSEVDPAINSSDSSNKDNMLYSPGNDGTEVIIYSMSKFPVTIKPPVDGFMPDTTYTEGQVMAAIECLLKCKGNKKPAAISGVTSLYVSQFYPRATVEIAALFYISYLYKANYTHSMGIALWMNKKFNPPGAVEIAYEYYEKWFEKVKKIGLAKARELQLEPLEGSGVSWY